MIQRRTTALILILAVCGFTAFLINHGVSIAGGSDSSGYFNSAKLITEGRMIDHVRPIAGLTPPDWHYYFQQPLGFTEIYDTGAMAPTYPVGLPLMILAAAQVTGWDGAAILVNVVCALGCGVLLVMFGRDFCGLRWPWLVFATVLLWVCPLFIFFSLQPMSDMPATFCVLLTFYAAAASGRSARWALLAGAATGMAVLVRPTNLLLAVPVMVLFGLNWRCWLAYAAAGLPFAAVQAYYNHLLYGSAFSSGYGDVFALFKTEFAKHNIVHFAHWIPQLLTPVVVLAVGLPWLVRRSPRIVFAVSLWCFLLIGFYAYYFHSGETWWYLRFILPAFPGLILLAMMTAQRLTLFCSSIPGRIAIITVAISLTTFQQVSLNRRLHTTEVKHSEGAYLHTVQWLESNVPKSAIIAAMQASGALHFYTDFALLRYDLMPPEQFAHAVQTARMNGQEIYAPLFPFEIERVVGVNLGGEWEQVATVDYITIWRLQP